MIRIYYNRFINYINRKFRTCIMYYYLAKHGLNDWSMYINQNKNTAATQRPKTS